MFQHEHQWPVLTLVSFTLQKFSTLDCTPWSGWNDTFYHWNEKQSWQLEVISYDTSCPRSLFPVLQCLPDVSHHVRELPCRTPAAGLVIFQTEVRKKITRALVKNFQQHFLGDIGLKFSFSESSAPQARVFVIAPEARTLSPVFSQPPLLARRKKLDLNTKQEEKKGEFQQLEKVLFSQIFHFLFCSTTCSSGIACHRNQGIFCIFFLLLFQV